MNQLLLENLQNQWLAIVHQLSGNSTVAKSAFFTLVEAYSEPQRFYHTLHHIDAVLQDIDRLQFMAQDFHAIQLGVWFHDVIYNTQSNLNEEASADYAIKALTTLEIAVPTIEKVTHLILTTKHHCAEPSDQDAHILLDADLAILGANPIQYKDYALAIRQEYAWVPAPDYRLGRCRVLERFLERERLYLTEVMDRELDAIARTNLQSELQALQKS
jgi:predicted metal-dependent HD superfamily phosphohydrolase